MRRPSLIRFVGQLQRFDTWPRCLTFASEGRAYVLSVTKAQALAARGHIGRNLRVTAVRSGRGLPRLLRLDEPGHQHPSVEVAASANLSRWGLLLDRLARRASR